MSTHEEEVFLSVDIKRIEKVILNLISNAIKFTDEGGNIEVYIETDWKESRVYIYVKDDGVGIPQKDIKTIFNIFNQVDSTFSRRSRGEWNRALLNKSICRNAWWRYIIKK